MSATFQPPVDSIMHHQLASILNNIEEEHDIDILLAVEQGSRAWGLDSDASDHDIRFIYREKPEQAFSLFRKGDTIQKQIVLHNHHGPVDVEMSGWALQKTLKLATVSNSQIGEMVLATTAYRRNDRFHQDLLNLFSHASPRAMAYFYYGDAKKNLTGKICKSDISDIKNNLQMIRAIFNALWLEKKQQGFPPPDFITLHQDMDFMIEREVFTDIEPELLYREIDELVALKRSGAPRKTEKKFNIVSQWASVEINALQRDIPKMPNPDFNKANVDKVFQRQYPECFEPMDINSPSIP